MTPEPVAGVGYSAGNAEAGDDVRKEMPETRYVLGHSEEELNRLAMQSRLIEPITRRFFVEAGIGPGMSVLDAGSGGGDVSFLVAGLVGPGGKVVGVEREPAALAVSRGRAAALGLGGICSFHQSDLADLDLQERFDAVVGRYVLEFQPDPAKVLGVLLKQLKPRGLAVFHEPDWSHASSFPMLSHWQRCCELVVATMTHGGADMRMGMKLPRLFESVGLAAPSLRMATVIGAGHNCFDAVHFTADVPMTVLAQAVSAGYVKADDIDPKTYVDSLIAEVGASGSVVIGRSDVAAWSRCGEGTEG